jgi:hypothetical protein
MNKDNLKDIINDDDLGLLEGTKKFVGSTPEDRLIQSFTEVNDFFDTYGKEPAKNDGIHERKLAARLESIRSNESYKNLLRNYDKHNLLDQVQVKTFNNIDEILQDDDMDLLDVEEGSIFTLANVPKGSKKLDEVARRRPCKDFELYEPLFVQVQEDLKTGKRLLEKFVENQQLNKGTFFVAGGVLGVIISADLTKDDQGRRNGRLYCVFENGTESNLLLQSLVRYLTVDYPGKIVVENNPAERLFNPEDTKSGYIYVLRSLSPNPDIAGVKNLYKIGFSEITVEERIKNAEIDPTFLMAPVKIVSVFDCFNMSTHRLERLLHRFFGEVKLNIDITNKNGERYTPKEWFIAPIAVITETISRIVDGTIVDYRYDPGSQSIVKRSI